MTTSHHHSRRGKHTRAISAGKKNASRGKQRDHRGKGKIKGGHSGKEKEKCEHHENEDSLQAYDCNLTKQECQVTGHCHRVKYSGGERGFNERERNRNGSTSNTRGHERNKNDNWKRCQLGIFECTETQHGHTRMQLKEIAMRMGAGKVEVATASPEVDQWCDNQEPDAWGELNEQSEHAYIDNEKDKSGSEEETSDLDVIREWIEDGSMSPDLNKVPRRVQEALKADEHRTQCRNTPEMGDKPIQLRIVEAVNLSTNRREETDEELMESGEEADDEAEDTLTRMDFYEFLTERTPVREHEIPGCVPSHEVLRTLAMAPVNPLPFLANRALKTKKRLLSKLRTSPGPFYDREDMLTLGKLSTNTLRRVLKLRGKQFTYRYGKEGSHRRFYNQMKKWYEISMDASRRGTICDMMGKGILFTTMVPIFHREVVHSSNLLKTAWRIATSPATRETMVLPPEYRFVSPKLSHSSGRRFLGSDPGTIFGRNRVAGEAQIESETNSFHYFNKEFGSTSREEIYPHMLRHMLADDRHLKQEVIDRDGLLRESFRTSGKAEMAAYRERHKEIAFVNTVAQNTVLYYIQYSWYIALVHFNCHSISDKPDFPFGIARKARTM